MARTGIDTSILHKGAHSASYFDLARSAGEGSTATTSATTLDSTAAV